jgi:hypothetical protein
MCLKEGMKIIQIDCLRKIATGAAFLALATSFALAQDQKPEMAPDAPNPALPPPPQEQGAVDPSAPQTNRPPAPPELGRERARGPMGDKAGPAGRRREAPTQVQGTVSRYLLNAFGEVDGLLLANGTQAHFSPKISATLTTTVKSGDVVVMSGNQESNLVFRADSITNTSSGAVAALEDDRAPGPRTELPPEIRGAQLQRLERSGTVSSVLYAPRGEIRGAILEDGSQFVIPGRRPETDQVALQAGVSVEVKGYGTSNAFGTCLEPTEISINGSPAIELYQAR